VEQVRELRETCKYAPASSQFKIYIIDEVHMLSTSAFNALLKTLEEPPAHVKFMFATTDPEKVLPTILSRCQRFDLRRIPAALIVKHLAHIAKLEKVKIDNAALYAIARGADGAMRDAESTLDQLISFCGEKIEEPDVLSMFGLTAQSQILNIAGAILAGEAEPALRELNDLAQHGKDLGRLLSDLLNHFRNLLIYQVSRGDLNLIEVSEAEGASLARQSANVSADALTRVMEVLAGAEAQLREAASKRISVEVALLKAIEARNAVSLDSVLKQLQALRDGKDSSTVPTPTPAPKPGPPHRAEAGALARAAAHAAPSATAPAQAKTASSPPSATTSENRTDLEELWGKIVEAVGRVSPFTRSYLLEAHLVSISKNVLTIGFDPEFEDHIGLVDNARNHTLLQTKLQELGHPNVQIKFIKAEAPEGHVSRVTAAAKAAAAGTAESKPGREKTLQAFNPDDFKNDPLIRKALEIFKGQIVEVRA